MTGMVGADIASVSGGGSRSIVGESTLTADFGARTVSGRATNFWEVVGGTDSNGQMRVTQWVQGLDGSLNQTGVIAHSSLSSGIGLNSSGNLTGTMEVNGQNVAGTYRVVANNNILVFMQKGSTIYALGEPGQYSNATVTFTPNGGGPALPVCYNNNCASNPTLGVGHVLIVN